MTTRRRRPGAGARAGASCSQPAASTVSLGALLAACGESARGRARPRRLRPAADRRCRGRGQRRRVPAHGDVDRVHDRSTSTARSPRAALSTRPTRRCVDRLVEDHRAAADDARRADHRGRRRALRVRQRLVHGARRPADLRRTSTATRTRTSRRATTRRATCSCSSTAWSRWRRRCTRSCVETLTEPELRAEVMVLGAQDAPPRGRGGDPSPPARPRATSARRCSARSSSPTSGPHAALRHPDAVRHRWPPIADQVGAPNEAGTRFTTPSRPPPTTPTSTTG